MVILVRMAQMARRVSLVLRQEFPLRLRRIISRQDNLVPVLVVGTAAAAAAVVAEILERAAHAPVAAVMPTAVAVVVAAAVALAVAVDMAVVALSLSTSLRMAQGAE